MPRWLTPGCWCCITKVKGASENDDRKVHVRASRLHAMLVVNGAMDVTSKHAQAWDRQMSIAICSGQSLKDGKVKETHPASLPDEDAGELAAGLTTNANCGAGRRRRTVPHERWLGTAVQPAPTLRTGTNDGEPNADDRRRPAQSRDILVHWRPTRTARSRTRPEQSWMLEKEPARVGVVWVCAGVARGRVLLLAPTARTSTPTTVGWRFQTENAATRTRCCGT